MDVNELFMDYQSFYNINLLLDKELLPIQKMPKPGIREHEIVKLAKKKFGIKEKFQGHFGYSFTL